MNSHFPLSGALLSLSLAALATAESAHFYQSPQPLFTTSPDEKKSVENISRFGPVGLSIDLIQPAFTMRVAGVEEKSPAAATGKFSKGQIIETVNGEKLHDIDPRMQMGRWIEQAEASDGKLSFAIRGETAPVIVELPVLGAYSKTWPLDCPKSNKIVRGLADYIAASPEHYGKGQIGMWFLISTGDPKDTEAVGRWARQHQFNNYAWYLGFGGVPMCEYYLRTGDKEVLPIIQDGVNKAVATQHNDAWAGRGAVPGLFYGMGHLNAAGTSVLTFLLLAKECGADVPDATLLGALRHFYRFSGKGANPYGDHRPEVGFVDNGKTGNLAFAMAAAASLMPDGENSIYAEARDANALSGFYTTTYMLHGHTGGGIGEIWRSASMGLMRDREPEHYREFMENRRWHYELSRRFDGSFGIQGGAGYDAESWGCAYGLAYTVPRKTMRITGAAPTKFSKPYALPKSIWGNEADHEFLSLTAVPDKSGKAADLSKETLAENSALPVINKLHADDVSDDTLRFYAHHQDPVIRETAAAKAAGINRNYIAWRTLSGSARPSLILEFLNSPSPRVRRAMFSALNDAIGRENQVALLTPEVFSLAIKSVSDPEESWWIKDAALQVIGHASSEQVFPHTDMLLSFLKLNEWWLQNAAMQALTPVAADPRCAPKVLPAFGDLLRTNQRTALAAGLPAEILDRLKASPPDVQQLAIRTLSKSYAGYTGVNTEPGGQDVSSIRAGHLEQMAISMSKIPGGLDVLYQLVSQQCAGKTLPYKKLFIEADPTMIGDELHQAIPPIIKDEMIPEFVGRNRQKLQELAQPEKQELQPGSKGDAIDGLVDLYHRIGNDAYQWKTFADLREADWHYHTFDPIESERVPWDALITRYRQVTLPQGMEKWYAPDFNADAADWKLGKSPFGNYNGKLPEGPVSKCHEKCVGPICYGAKPAHTLWDKEVILMRKTIQVPSLKEGYRYRVRVNHRAHVGNGGGYAIYINGRLLAEQKRCLGLGTGEDANGGFITKDFIKEFEGGSVTIAAISFLRYGDKFSGKPKTNIPEGLISIDIEAQKLPPMGDDLIIQSATSAAMATSAWHEAKLDAENNKDTDLDSLLFHWNGNMIPNPQATGRWKLLGNTENPETFDPAKISPATRPFVDQLNLGETRETGTSLILWTGEKLLNLHTYEAHQIIVRKVSGKLYLFAESGGFNGMPTNSPSPRWLVFGKN